MQIIKASVRPMPGKSHDEALVERLTMTIAWEPIEGGHDELVVTLSPPPVPEDLATFFAELAERLVMREMPDLTIEGG